MYITETTRIGPNGTVYRCVLLRRFSREGNKVKKRTIANLSHCTPQEIEALRLALRYKDDLRRPGLCPRCLGAPKRSRRGRRLHHLPCGPPIGN